MKVNGGFYLVLISKQGRDIIVKHSAFHYSWEARKKGIGAGLCASRVCQNSEPAGIQTPVADGSPARNNLKQKRK
jgi:hypothetical protein